MYGAEGFLVQALMANPSLIFWNRNRNWTWTWNWSAAQLSLAPGEVGELSRVVRNQPLALPCLAVPAQLASSYLVAVAQRLHTAGPALAQADLPYRLEEGMEPVVVAC